MRFRHCCRQRHPLAGSLAANVRVRGTQARVQLVPSSASASGALSALLDSRPVQTAQTVPLLSPLQMEAAFCAYLGRASSVSAQLVRWLQLAAWLVALLKWMYRSATGHPLASQTVLEWAAGGSLVLLVVVAGGRPLILCLVVLCAGPPGLTEVMTGGVCHFVGCGVASCGRSSGMRAVCGDSGSSAAASIVTPCALGPRPQGCAGTTGPTSSHSVPVVCSCRVHVAAAAAGGAPLRAPRDAEGPEQPGHDGAEDVRHRHLRAQARRQLAAGWCIAARSSTDSARSCSCRRPWRPATRPVDFKANELLCACEAREQSTGQELFAALLRVQLCPSAC